MTHLIINRQCKHGFYTLLANVFYMKLKLEHIDEETGIKIIVKNKGDEVYFHNSDCHDPKEFEKLTGQVFNADDIERDLIDAFYRLAGQLA